MVEQGFQIRIGGRHQGGLLTQKAAQAGVDKASLALQPTGPGRLHGLIDQGEGGVGGLRRIPDQGQGGTQQRIDFVRRFFGGQLGPQRLRPPQVAQHLKQQRLHARAQRGHDGLQHRGG